MSEYRHRRILRGPIGAVMMVTPLVVGALLFEAGCGGGVGGGSTDASSSSGTGASALNFKGVATGVVSESRSTRESLDAADGNGAQQALPPDIDPALVTVTLEDLSGEALLGADNRPYPPASVDETGEFSIEGLPVGVEFVVAVDLDGDGEPDVRHVIMIPADETGEAGRIDDVVVDPLTTLVVARLRELFAEHGVNPAELDISPAAIVQRIVDAFIHLFEESGIDKSLTVEDIRALAGGRVEEFFDRVLPAAVRAGIETVKGNLALERASEIEGVVRAAAEVFLRAGFPIADDPGGIDLSFLADLPDVEVRSIDSFRPPDEMPMEPTPAQEVGLDESLIDDLEAGGTLDDLLADGTLDDLLTDGSLGDILADGGVDDGFLDDLEGTLPETIFPFDPALGGPVPLVYVSTVTEPDRNFISNDEFDPEAGAHHLPMLNEHLLRRVARLHLEGRIITLHSLYRLLTDEGIGLGVRLTYAVPTPGRQGPPSMVFESADGSGVVRDMESIFAELREAGLVGPEADFDDLVSRADRIRERLREWLAGTVPPSMERLFGAILSERIASVEQLTNFIRQTRAHLPFSRSGPARFFVIADGDPFRPDAGEVHPVSVDVRFGEDGSPIHVTYNPQHTGRYFLGFTHETEVNNLVELLVRETGRWLHGPNGEPIFLDMGDQTLFDPVDGIPFVDFVSEEGTFWPGVPVTATNPEFRMGEEIGGGSNDPTVQLFVLATAPGPEAEPVRVDYDAATGTFTASSTGRYYMMFVPETHERGVFGLYDVDLNFMASVHDLTGERFVEGPPVFPEEPLPPPPDGEFPPPDEPFPPLDEGIIPPPDEELTPPPDENVTPPDMDQQPPADEPPATQEVPGTGDQPPPPPPDEPPPPGDEPPPPGDEPPPPGDEFPPPGEEPPPPGDEFPPPGEEPPPPGDEFPPPDEEPFPPPNEEFPPFPEGEPPPPDEGLPPPPQPEPIFVFEPALVAPEEVVGLNVKPEFFRFIYGTEVPNERFDPSGNPYFDDVNGNGIEDPGEFTADHRPTLFNPDDWRSTDISRYYRRQSGGAVTFDEVDFESREPRTLDGEALVARNYLPRLNAFRFGRPNTAINLLTTFMPPEFFDGTHAFDADTPLGIFQALATINLVMEQVFNVEATVDIDGDGPMEPRKMLMDAHLFVAPIGDPFALILDGFESLSEPRPERGE